MKVVSMAFAMREMLGNSTASDEFPVSICTMCKEPDALATREHEGNVEWGGYKYFAPYAAANWRLFTVMTAELASAIRRLDFISPVEK
jgi:hypothetical protein